MLRAFYDGSGKGEGRNTEAEFLTLAGIAAYENLWADVEAQWLARLEKHELPYIHMKYLADLRKCFQGKRRDIAEWAVSSFVALISSLDPEIYAAYGCTVNLADFRRAQADYPELQKRQPADLCVNWCTGGLRNRFVIDVDNRVVGDDLVVIVFDNGEEFEQRIRRIWAAVKKDESLLPSNRWVESVVTIMTLPSNDAPGLQAADVLAWNCNRHYCSGDRDDWFNAVWKNWPNEQVYYDYERVVAEYSTGVWVPPVRGATRP